MTEIQSIRAAYMAAVTALATDVPAQAGTAPYRREKAERMTLGRLKRRVQTTLYDFPAGTFVGVVPDDPGFVLVYAPGLSTGATLTLLTETTVEYMVEAKVAS